MSSPHQQVEDVAAALKAHHRDSRNFSQLEDAPKYICVEKLGEDPIDQVFYAWTNSGEYAEMRRVHERLALKILEVAEAACRSWFVEVG